MRIAQVIGSVTLNRSHPTFSGARLKLAVPLSLEELVDDLPAKSDPVVVYDELGAGLGSRIMLSEGPEAAQPFLPELKPVDAYNAGILDHVEVRLTTQ